MSSLLLNKANNPKTFTTPAPLARVSAASKDAGKNEPTLEIQTVPPGPAPVWGPTTISINATKIPVGAGGIAAGTNYRFVANFMSDDQSITISFT
jgi:hypothetical protein